VNCSNQILNDDYVEALAQGLSVSKFVSRLNMSGTRISTRGATMTINLMNKQLVKHLDLSYNSTIGPEFYRQLADILDDPRTSLEYLSLEANNMGDKPLGYLCEKICQNSNLTVLNLSKNNITDQGVGVYSSSQHEEGTGLCKVLRHCKNIRGLFLHFNRILGPGGAQLARSLTSNRFLKVLDISFNQICGGITSRDMEKALTARHDYASSWAECFKRNADLIHVDISNNNLRLLEMEIIAEGLKTNHTILGIHIMGNEAEIDNKGFVQTSLEEHAFENRLLGPQLMTRINPQFENSTGIIKGQVALELKVSDNCWICEGYRHFEFTFKPGVCSAVFDAEFFKQNPRPALYLHLEQDDYKPDLMIPDNEESPALFSSIRMIKPSRDQKYFFSVNRKAFAANFKPKQSMLNTTLKVKKSPRAPPPQELLKMYDK